MPTPSRHQIDLPSIGGSNSTEAFNWRASATNRDRSAGLQRAETPARKGPDDCRCERCGELSGIEPERDASVEATRSTENVTAKVHRPKPGFDCAASSLM
jgi:ribosomal protein L34E